VNDIAGRSSTTAEKSADQTGGFMEETIKKARQTLIEPDRDIVASYAQELRRNLWSLIEEGVTDVSINLAHVQMIDSIGLGVLIAAHNALKKKQGRLAIVNVSKEILGLLKTMRLDRHFDIQE
jgi:anti-sigma B factor antagonist